MRSGKWVGVGLVAAAALAFAADDISKMAAKDAMKKAATTMEALPGYHVTMNVEIAAVAGGLKAEGIYVKPDTYYLKSDAGFEMYLKGKKAVANNPANGQWQEAKDLDPAVGAALAVAQNINPASIIAMMSKSGASKFREDEKLGEIDCKVVEVPGSPDDVKKLLEDQLKDIPMLKGANPGQFLDTKKSSSTWIAWIGKEDLLIHKLEGNVHAEMKANPNLPIPSMDQKMTIEISKHGQELELNAPDEVKKKLGLK
ncbi:MAG: DUF6612 family protein [Planctomycetota bacterium]